MLETLKCRRQKLGANIKDNSLLIFSSLKILSSSVIFSAKPKDLYRLGRGSRFQMEGSY